MQRANLWLRTASRIVVRMGEFRARGFPELERRARRLPWQRFVGPVSSVRFRVTAKKSRLYHTEAIVERLAEAVQKTTGATDSTASHSDDLDEAESLSGQLFIVRIHRDVVTISADSSGELLHRRGYRLATAKAPLRETLAAAMILGSGWHGEAPLVDPLCGSGTIAIEAALLARRIAPGLRRRFAFADWPEFIPDVWARLRNEAEAACLPDAAAAIIASDRNAGAVEAALANAERAGVAADVQWAIRAVSGLHVPHLLGVVLTNPPYGQRLGEHNDVRDLYAQLGHVLRSRCRGWTVGLLSPEPRLHAQLGLPLRECFRTSNGGIPVRLMLGTIP